MLDCRIIDTDNYRESGVEVLTFPGGEPHVKIPRFGLKPVLVYAKLRTWQDVGYCACLISALEQQVAKFKVFIPYFPGARQDRSNGTAPMTVDLMVRLLCPSEKSARRTYLFDPHSLVLLNALGYDNEARMLLGSTKDGKRHIFMPSDLDVPIKEDVVGIICPDNGAMLRTLDFQRKFYPYAKILYCSKNRDPRTGMLSGYEMPPLPCAGRYIIVDDICDGGGTFNLLANEFKKDKWGECSKLELFVSHGIFSKGFEAIDPKIERITTTNGLCNCLYHRFFNDQYQAALRSRRLSIVSLDPILSKLGKELTEDAS